MKLWQATFGQAESRLQLAGWLLAFAFPIFALVVDKAASTIFAIFFLAGVYLFIRGRYERPDPLLRWVLFAFAAYFLVGLLSFVLADEQTRLGEKLLGRDVRFVGAVTVAFALSRLGLPAPLLVRALAIGAIITGVVALLQVGMAESTAYRAHGETISILFGHLSAALFVVNAVICLDKEGAVRRLAAAGALFALIAVLLSATRGALLTVALVILLMVVVCVRRQAKELVLVILSLAVITVGFSLTQSGSAFLARFAVLATEIVETDSAGALDMAARSALPGCRNDVEFLSWLEANSLIGGKGRLLVRVTGLDAEARDQLQLHGCNAQEALFLENESKRRSAWIYLPPRNVPESASGGGTVLVRGTGLAGLGGAPAETRVPIDSENFDTLVFQAHPASNARHLFVLRPGDSLQIIPLLTRPAEYGFEPMGSGRLRLAMWEASAHAFLQQPWSGYGAGTYPNVMAERASAGSAAWQLASFDHPHNEFLTVALERGVLGVLSLIAIYAAVFAFFFRRQDVFGHAGMGLVGAFVLSGLTETIFNHSLGITYYCMLVLLLATASREQGAAPDAFK